VAVIGAGRVGLVTGLALWERGHAVLFVDADPARVARLARGEAPFFEPGVGDLLARAAASGSLEASVDPAAALSCEVALVCVPTPGGATGAVDTRFLARAAGELAAAVEAGGVGRLRTVLVRSTAVPGTTRRVVVAALGGAVDVGYMPEFLREGSALDDAREPDRVVLGADAPCVAGVARALWGSEAPLVETSIETAEMAKYASNALLALCVSFSNELAAVAERLPGVDARDVLDAVARDRRLAIGARRAAITSYLEPGPGFGGSCLGKDVRALSALAGALSVASPLLEGTLQINDAQPGRFVARVARALGSSGGLAGRAVLVLGLAFKPLTDDVRDSVAFPVVEALEGRGARVVGHDPAAAQAFFDGRRGAAAQAGDWRAALEEAEVLVLLAPWPEYLEALPSLLAARARPLLLADARGALRAAALPPSVAYLGVGKATDEEARSGRTIA
jgi:UDPglucose 6-dehydrogenase